MTAYLPPIRKQKRIEQCTMLWKMHARLLDGFLGSEMNGSKEVENSSHDTAIERSTAGEQ